MNILKVTFLFVFLFLVSNVEFRDINDYTSGVKWKFYGDNWDSGVLPITYISNELVEGRDFVRSYAFTRSIVDNYSKLNFISYKKAKEVIQLPGSVCEKITGLGRYKSESVICHVVFGYVYIKADDITIFEGEEMPDFSYTIFNYNDLADDIEKYFDVSIEMIKTDTIGEYYLVPRFKLKSDSYVIEKFINNQEKGSIQYVFKNLGRIIIEPVNGCLTVLENGKKDLDYYY